MPVYPNQLPECIRKDPRRITELKIYNYFNEHLPQDYTVIYSAEWICSFQERGVENLTDPVTNERASGNYYPLGEVDFILATPKSLLVLEVKGGEVFVEGGTWFSTNREGIINDIEDPLSQARRNMFAVLKTLNNSRRFYNRFFNIGYAVVLPNTLIWQQNITNQNLIIFKEQINESLLVKINEIIGFWKHTWSRQNRTIEDLSEADIKHIIKVFAPTVELRKPSLRQDIEIFQDHLLKLTERQFEVLKCLAKNKKAVITGGPGTGKTLLAIEKARQTARQGHKTLFTCPNRLLSRHVKNQFNEIDNLEVMNFHELCYRWGVQAGIEGLVDPDGPDRHTLKQSDYFITLPEALADATANIACRFEAVIVDEAQDMKNIYWTALDHCLSEDPVYYIFCDPNQSIWHVNDKLPFSEPSFDLQRNLRNSRKVFDALKVLCDDMDYTGECTEEGKFEIVITNANHIVHKLEELLTQLVGQGFSRRDIAIITGRSRDGSVLANTESIGDYTLTGDLFDKEDRVLFSSVRQYRGMESAAVIMIEVDYIVDLIKLRDELGDRIDLADDEKKLENIAKETLLIGMSRAQHSLIILADAETKGRLHDMGLATSL